MKEYCQNPLCESKAIRKVPVSVKTGFDQTRAIRTDNRHHKIRGHWENEDRVETKQSKPDERVCRKSEGAHRRSRSESKAPDRVAASEPEKLDTKFYAVSTDSTWPVVDGETVFQDPEIADILGHAH